MEAGQVAAAVKTNRRRYSSFERYLLLELEELLKHGMGRRSNRRKVSKDSLAVIDPPGKGPREGSSSNGCAPRAIAFRTRPAARSPHN